MQVYKERMRSLREVVQAAILRGDETLFLVYGERTYGFRTFVETANGVARALATKYGVGPRPRRAVLSQNNPEWCVAFWATVSQGAVLVGLNGWWKADEILYGLQDSGSTVLVADAKRFERIADRWTRRRTCSTSSSSTPSRRLPGGDWQPRDPAPVRRADRRAHRRVPRRRHRRGRRRGDLLHLGTTGRPKGAISTHRSMIANLQNTMYITVAGAMANPAGGAILGGGGPTVSLLAAVPRVGLPLRTGGGHAGGDQDRHPHRALRPGRGAAPHRGATSPWATVPTMVWRVCEFPGRHDYDTSTVTSVAFGGSPSADELQRKVHDTFPNVRTTSNATA